MAVKGFQQIDLTDGSVKQLTVPAGSDRCHVQATAANASMRLDGTDPTATVGRILVANGDPVELTLFGGMVAAKFIKATGSPLINVHYFGSDSP